MNYWPLICIAGSAVCWAAASVLLFRFGTSVFRNLNPEFWNPVISSKAAKQIFGYKVDAFHLLQSMAIVLFCIPAAFSHEWLVFKPDWMSGVLKLALLGVAWIFVFPVTYGLLSPYHKKVPNESL